MLEKLSAKVIWVRSWRCCCLVTWFCYQLIAKPGNKTVTPSWPEPYLIGFGPTVRSYYLKHYICTRISSFVWLIWSLSQSRFAYIEFADKDSVTAAVSLDESLFRGRQIKVRFFWNDKRRNYFFLILFFFWFFVTFSVIQCKTAVFRLLIVHQGDTLDTLFQGRQIKVRMIWAHKRRKFFSADALQSYAKA